MSQAEKIELDHDEVVLAMVRRHWFVLFAQAGIFLVLLTVPFFLFVSINSLAHLNPEVLASVDRYVKNYASIFYIAWVIILWMGIFTAISNYYLDVWTVTNKRLVIVDQVTFFNRKTASFRLERIQDIHVSVDGIIATFFNFGTLEVHTASGDQTFLETMLPDPQNLKALIFKAVDERTNGSGRMFAVEQP